jgi:hypothetical protein
MGASFPLRVYSVLGNCVDSFDAMRLHDSMGERDVGRQKEEKKRKEPCKEKRTVVFRWATEGRLSQPSYGE